MNRKWQEGKQLSRSDLVTSKVHTEQVRIDDTCLDRARGGRRDMDRGGKTGARAPSSRAT